MIVQCAACQARFKIADDKVTDRGVKVRCRKCATVFVVHRDSAPAPDAPPLGRVDTGKPRLAAPAPRPASAPSPGPAAPAPRPDAFRRFQTKELTGADPFLQPAKLARPDPFAGLGPSPAPAARAAPQASADPFASLELGTPIATPQQDVFGEQAVRKDVSATAGQLSQQPRADPFGVGTVRKTLPPQGPARASADPFASLELGGATARKPTTPHTVRPPTDPFAHLAAAAAAQAPAPAAAPAQRTQRKESPLLRRQALCMAHATGG